MRTSWPTPGDLKRWFGWLAYTEAGVRHCDGQRKRSWSASTAALLSARCEASCWRTVGGFRRESIHPHCENRRQRNRHRGAEPAQRGWLAVDRREDPGAAQAHSGDRIPPRAGRSDHRTRPDGHPARRRPLGAVTSLTVEVGPVAGRRTESISFADRPAPQPGRGQALPAGGAWTGCLRVLAAGVERIVAGVGLVGSCSSSPGMSMGGPSLRGPGSPRPAVQVFLRGNREFAGRLLVDQLLLLREAKVISWSPRSPTRFSLKAL